MGFNICYSGEQEYLWNDGKFTGDRRFCREVWSHELNEIEIINVLCDYSCEYEVRPRDMLLFRKLIDDWKYEDKTRYYLLCALLEDDPLSRVYLSY